MLVTLEKILDFLEVDKGYFVVNASHDVLVLAYDGGSAESVEVSDGTYDGASLATELQSKIDIAFTISSTVTYSTSTKKFTIDVGVGHTITYTHAGSDAGLLFGFDTDHSASQTITSDLAASDPSSAISDIHNAVEKWVKNDTRRDLESTTYTERYDGDGEDELELRNYPITQITRVSIGSFDCIRIKNTDSGTSASISVNSTGIILTKDGVSDSTVLFATYSTMTDIVTAINLISGWSAVLVDNNYSTYLSTELIQMFGRNAIDNNDVYLMIPETPLDDFETDAEAGILKRRYFTEGFQNILVQYTAGYFTIPNDLQLAVKIITKNVYQKRQDEIFGIKSYSTGGIKVEIKEEDIPSEAKKIINFYRRYLI